MWPAISRFLLRKSFHDAFLSSSRTLIASLCEAIAPGLCFLLPIPYSLSFHPAANCRARSVARITALISVTRNPPSSNSRMPSIVHPAGVVTASFSSAGW